MTGKLTGRACASLAGLIVAACIVYDRWENHRLQQRRAVKKAHRDELAAQSRPTSFYLDGRRIS